MANTAEQAAKNPIWGHSECVSGARNLRFMESDAFDRTPENFKCLRSDEFLPG